MKLLPMIFPVLVGAHSKLVPLALDHESHWSPCFSRTSFCQFTTASAMAEPRPSNSFVLVKGRNLALPEAVTTSSLHWPCALAGSTTTPAISSVVHAVANPKNRAAEFISNVPLTRTFLQF